jgi:hypothetical protein
MSKKFVLAGIAAVGLTFVASSAMAGPISNACMQSNRTSASNSLCACIQRVADGTLRGSDQRRAASFFRDPDKAQQVRMSKSRNENAFWARYKLFGQQAESSCTG